MGDLKGGGREAAGLPVIQAVADLVQLFNSGGRQLGKLNLLRMGEGIYQLDVGEHNAEDWETLYISPSDDGRQGAASTPSGGSSRKREER